MEVDLAGHAPSKRNEAPPVRAAGRPEPLALEVGNLARPDLATVDALCRVALEVRRCEGRVSLEGASAALLELIDLAGLTRILAPGPRRRRAAERHAARGTISSRASARPGSR
jgi:ABC-type transporter Mla MlaB component